MQGYRPNLWTYTKYINRLHGRSGHLWQNRFFSCSMDDEHMLAALIYTERNPVRAKLVKRAWEYDWSSAGAHVEGSDRYGILNMANWRNITGGGEWRELLVREEDTYNTNKLRSHTNHGRPLGDDAFLSKIEKTLGRRLRTLPAGRKAKKRQ